jgi:Zn-dependent M28 family amino/carboxypeptidase
VSALDDLGLQGRRHAYGGGTNVYAELPGDGTIAGWIVVGAHFDSVSGSPGANDNATGVALVMAVARYLTEVECRRRGVIVVFFDQEEVGLVGSEEFAAKLKADATNVAAVHTVDQMGWDGDGDRAVELERADTGLYQQYAAGKQGAGLNMALTPTQTGSTDHVSFRNEGFAAIGITEEYVSGDTTPHYHLSSDTYATVNFDYLASTTALVSHTLAAVVRGEISALAGEPMPAPLPGRARPIGPR